MQETFEKKAEEKSKPNEQRQKTDRSKESFARLLRIRIYGFFPFLYQVRYRVIATPKKTFNKFFPTIGCPESEKKAVYKDMIRSFWKYGFLFDEYFYFDLYNKSKAERAAFINETNRFYYYRKCNTIRSCRLFASKYKTYQKFRAFFKRDVIICRKASDFDAFAAFARRNPKFIRKPFDESLGKGILIYEPKTESEIRKIFDSNLANGGTLYCEGYVTQVKELAAFNESSLNTIRIPTLLTGKSPESYRVHLFYPSIRFGRAGAVVDNAGSGGITVQIDAATGKLFPIGRDKDNHSYTKHPDSQLPFEGFAVPRWDEAVAFAKQLALTCPENRFTGWDVALTDDGWVMIEGNGRSQFFGRQVCDRIGKKPEMDALMKHLKE